MPRITVLNILDQERATLEKAAKYGPSYSFCLRCQTMLLKTDAQNQRTSLAIAKWLGC